MIELLFTGAETVSSAGFTVAYQLMKNKNFISNLRSELQHHDLGDKSQTICLNNLKTMDYLDAVVNESLRTIPPIGGFFRKVKETFELEVNISCHCFFFQYYALNDSWLNGVFFGERSKFISSREHHR